MRYGTFSCWLWGHKFHGERVEYHPHYQKLVEQGHAAIMTNRDMHLVGFPTDYCVRCGAKDVPSTK